MAIYSAVPPPHEQQPAVSASHPPSHQHTLSSASTASLDIEAWTVSALQSLSISPGAVGVGNPLSIPLDASSETQTQTRMKLRNVTIHPDAVGVGASIAAPRKPVLRRRDSMERREALLKGKEGSRQRRRWENDRLLHLPNVEPPTPADWDVRPTYPVHHIPYQLAAFWDQKGTVRERVAASGSERSSKRTTGVGKVPRDLHTKAKRTPAVKSWLRVLEEPVRQFLVDNRAQKGESDTSELDSEDEEIVFVGRNGSMTDAREWKKAHRERKGREVQRGMVVEDDGADEESASFKRWLTHSISDYYGLDSKSVEVGTPAKKVVYIGIKQVLMPTRELPRPLWEMF
ncbi:R3H-associated N-terminal domain-containing protein [Coniochaeta sp. 2T2.1]|nr:R3H-associated N-terminal domain-containing protein [Coniochaeta sp. 2T2.1]